MIETLSALLTFAAIFSFFNEQFLKLEITIGLMLQAFLFAIAITSLSFFYADISDSKFLRLILEVDFSQVLLQGILCFLLFAGAKNISLKGLEEAKWNILTLAILATLMATFIIGSLVFVTFHIIGIQLSYLHALILGAIISPTDPIAAISILKRIGLPKSLEVIIDGESQFNDGVGVVIFVTLLSIETGNTNPELIHIATLFFKEIVGGIAIGLLIAFLTHFLVLHSKTTTTQILITLSAVSMGYAIAEKTGVSGPISSVVFGIIFGNVTLTKESIPRIQEHINVFWNTINQVLNAVLFVLVGLIALQVHILDSFIMIGIPVVITAVLIGRFISIYISMYLLGFEYKYNLRSQLEIVSLLTWAGLRGALAVALVLSLPDQPYKDILLPLIYGVVVFSILIQGTTLKKLFSPELLNQMIKKDY